MVKQRGTLFPFDWVLLKTLNGSCAMLDKIIRLNKKRKKGAGIFFFKAASFNNENVASNSLAIY
jgi:hypothetical protein